MDKEKFREDIDRFSDTVLRIAVQNTGNYQDAQDAVQEVFIKLYDLGDSLESDEHKKAWLIRVTVNVCRDILRKNRFASFEPLENYSCIEKEYENIELLDMIRRLPENQKNALYLHFYEGMSISEISKITGRRETTVGSDIHRAKKHLKLEISGKE